jgi:Domain of unknown function (DUF4115)
MSRLRVRVELNRGGVGVPLHKLASVVHEAQRFFDMLAEDVHISTEGGEWLGFDFDNESLNFTAEFVGPVSQDQIQAFYAAFDGTTSLRRATIAQFTQITEAIGEDELIGFGMYQSDQEPEPAEWRCLSRRDALRIAEEMHLLNGVAGEEPQATHLPSAIESSVGAKLFKDRSQRGVPLPERLPDLVREIESTLSKRITRIEDNMEMNTHAIRDLRESSVATEESFKGLLNAVENFCGQATKQLERLSPPVPAPAEIPKAIAAAPVVDAPVSAVVETPAVVTATAQAAEATIPQATAAIATPQAAEVSVMPQAATAPVSSQGPTTTAMPKAATAATPAAAATTATTPVAIDARRPGRGVRALMVAAAAVVILVTAGLLWWPRPSDAGQSLVGGNPSSVIASSGPASAGNIAPAPKTESEKAASVPSAPSTMWKPASSVAQPTAAATDASADSMQVEIQAQEPAWVMITDKDGKILIARTLQPNETRTIEVGDDALLRTGNAGGLHVRLNGKDLGHLGPVGKIRDVQFKSGAGKVLTPDAG